MRGGKKLVVGAALALVCALDPQGAWARPDRLERTKGDQASLDADLLGYTELDRPAPVDYAWGPGAGRRKGWKGTRGALRPLVDPVVSTVGGLLRPVTGLLSAGSAAPAAQAMMSSPPESEAAVKGVFGPSMTMPLIAIHASVLPDGRILSYGTTETGSQGGQFVYDIWDPALGTDASSHLVLPNTTAADIFCSAQTVLAANGDVLITGGDQTVGGQRNYSNQQTEILQASTSTLQAGPAMAFKRWYPALIPLANGEIAVLGGRQEPGIPAPTPEVYTPGQGWRTLTTATDENAYGAVSNAWYYPKAFQAPNGKVFIQTNAGRMYELDPAGTGSVTRLTPIGGAGAGSPTLPTLMFAPGKILSVRREQKVVVVDINGPRPIATQTALISQNRIWGNTTVLADGRVLANGGSEEANELVGVAYHVEIWDPATGLWTRGADSTVPRIYHSSALLLPDASVLIAGGGAPGPVRNLNAEVYYPPYLYKNDGSGQPAPRPQIVSAPASLRPGDPLTVMVGAEDAVSRVALVRTGSATHSFNGDQRFVPLGFEQRGAQILSTVPAANVLVPGYYMLFVIDAAGTPSVAKIVHVTI